MRASHGLLLGGLLALTLTPAARAVARDDDCQVQWRHHIREVHRLRDTLRADIRRRARDLGREIRRQRYDLRDRLRHELRDRRYDFRDRLRDRLRDQFRRHRRVMVV